MSIDQWHYLLRGRAGAAEKLTAATIVVDPVNSISVTGFVVVPDIWQCPAGCSFSASSGGFDSNSYEVGTTWDLMEASGAVFLPAGGRRDRKSFSVGYQGTSATYWTSSNNNGAWRAGSSSTTVYDDYDAHYVAIHITSETVQPSTGGCIEKSTGLTVRLVRSATP